MIKSLFLPDWCYYIPTKIWHRYPKISFHSYPNCCHFQAWDQYMGVNVDDAVYWSSNGGTICVDAATMSCLPSSYWGYRQPLVHTASVTSVAIYHYSFHKLHKSLTATPERGKINKVRIAICLSKLSRYLDTSKVWAGGYWRLQKIYLPL